MAEGALDARAVQAVLEARGAAAKRKRAWPGGLSDREVEVIRLVAVGRTNKEIGALLGMSPRTAQKHVMHVYEKLGLESRAGLALYAIEHGLLDPTPERTFGRQLAHGWHARAGMLGPGGPVMNRLRWWMRIVGAFYMLQFVMVALVRAPISAQAPPDTLARAAAGDPLARFLIDTWVTFGLEMLAIGVGLLIASRWSNEARPLVWTVIAIRSAGGSRPTSTCWHVGWTRRSRGSGW